MITVTKTDEAVAVLLPCIAYIIVQRSCPVGWTCMLNFGFYIGGDIFLSKH